MQAISDFRNRSKVYGRAVCHDICPLEYIRLNMPNVPVRNDKHYPTTFGDVCDIMVVTLDHAGIAIQHRTRWGEFGFNELR